jgi:hypothetical protein
MLLISTHVIMVIDCYAVYVVLIIGVESSVVLLAGGTTWLM